MHIGITLCENKNKRTKKINKRREKNQKNIVIENEMENNRNI